MTRRPAAGWVLLPALLLLGGCAGTAPASAPDATEPAPAPVVGATPKPKPAPKFHYTSREPVIGAYITTNGTPRAERAGWSTGPTSTEGTWYAHGTATDALLISSTATVTRIVWVLPDGSQRVQQGDLTYYNPETGIYE
ncbi:hypothetical protein E4U03_04765 [Rothia nasimurium]|uniref:Uncharacterized protein n=1 Tax=Rothia nasimurium TaxID=85336 RepID=A0A4Y9F5H2_9MICC|nr:hypothetical protein [Rothia nasimurium]MBF0807930.1 hypothetical protein [Rothia nasimurium]TFU22931.1 hypothetical protein E4U03_04765 [Rothia nasimurium]